MADVVETIGSGGTHATIAAWFSAHNAKDMVALGNRYIGELIDPVYEVDAGTLAAVNTGTRSATAYRWLRSATAAGHYRPERHTGVRVYVRWTGTSDQAGFRIDPTESFFRMSGFGVICEDPQEVTAGNHFGIQVQGDNFTASRMFVRISEGGNRASIGPPAFACYYINNVTGNNAADAVFLNCIAYGSPFFKGAHYGFYWDNFSANGGCYNCLAYTIRGSGGRGFFALTNVAVKPRLVNSVAVDCATGSGGLWESVALDPTNGSDPLAVDEPYQCIVSDYSLPFDASVPRVSANQNGIDARAVLARPDIQDVRPVPGCSVFGNGRDMSKIWTAFGFASEDYDGTARPAGKGGYLSLGWTIGPYTNSGSPLATTAPTVEVKSIGSAGGRDYANIQAFLDATDDQSLIYQNKVVVGECYADSDFTITAGQRVVARRTIADSRHYRELRPASGHEFDPLTGSGVRVKGDGGSASGENNLVEVHEAHFRLTGPMLVEVTYTGSASRRAVKIQSDDVRASSIFGKFVGSTGLFSHIILVRGSRVMLTNCVAKGSNSAGTGANNGITLQNCESSRVYCCVVWGIDGTSGKGFVEGANTSRVEISSCVAADCVADFFHTVGGNSKTTQSFCISSDTTADGLGAQKSVASATLFRGAAADDFRHVLGSPAIKRGRNLALRFSIDFTGGQRFSPFDVGAYEGLPPGPLFRAPTFRECRAVETLWELSRTDGTVLLFTDQNEPVVYRGRTYDVGGSFVASNRRAEADARTVGVKAAFSSAKITVGDLAARKYRGARLREILLGRYSWTAPIEENVYVLGNVEFDADAWETEFGSLSSLLERSAGRLVTVGCPYTVGDDECLVDLTPNTLDDVRVGATIQDARRKFNANTADVSGSFADDYFGKGKFVWLTGANAGVVCQVKSYVASTRTFELEEALPYDLVTNDTFLVQPGDRKRYLLDCIGKHSNGVNYGGEPFMPGTDKSLSTPTR